jgi:hypothetical protein
MYTYIYVRNTARNEWMYYIRENKIMNLNNLLKDTDNNEWIAWIYTYVYVCMYERIGFLQFVILYNQTRFHVSNPDIR